MSLAQILDAIPELFLIGLIVGAGILAVCVLAYVIWELATKGFDRL